MNKLAGYAPVDAAVDEKAKEFLHDCLPPALTPGVCLCACLHHKNEPNITEAYSTRSFRVPAASIRQ